MPIEHANIPDEDLHEIKGAASAVSGQVPVADGNGATDFRPLDYSELANTPSASGYILQIAGRQYTNQNPTTLDTAQTVVYGSGDSTSNVTLGSDGVITFDEAGQYQLLFVHRVGRTAATGTANFYMRYMFNSSAFGAPVVYSMDNSDVTYSHSITVNVDAQAGDTFRTQMLRDSSGVNYGGLFFDTPNAPGWDASPSATLVVYKFGGLS